MRDGCHLRTVDMSGSAGHVCACARHVQQKFCKHVNMLCVTSAFCVLLLPGMNDTSSSGTGSNTFSLKGEVSSSIAAVALLAQGDSGYVALTVHTPGLTGYVLARGQRVIHAETRSAEVDLLPGRTGHLVWKGREALFALALLANHPVEVEVRAVADPGPRFAQNVDTAITVLLLELAVAVDSSMSVSALPCAFEPMATPT